VISRPPGGLVDAILPQFDARTVQHRVVDADPAVVYDAIWEADLLSSRLARMLMAAARVPEMIVARQRGQHGPGGEGHWRLTQAVDDDSPWILLGDRPGTEVVLGLLWTPPAGGTTCAPEAFAQFWRRGVAKVTWSLAVVPYGRGSVLITETRTLALDRTARLRPAAEDPAARARAGAPRGRCVRGDGGRVCGLRSHRRLRPGALQPDRCCCGRRGLRADRRRRPCALDVAA
jgi:hypothetical protein